MEIKTHKYKLLKDIPKLSNPEDKPDKTEREPPVGEVTDAEPVPGTSAQIDVAPVVPKLSGGEKCKWIRSYFGAPIPDLNLHFQSP